jgi:Signal transduction histidine kinase
VALSARRHGPVVGPHPAAGWPAVVLVVLAVLAPVMWVAALRATGVSDGTTTYPAAPPWSSAGVVVADVVGGSALRPGDRVVAVDGVPLADLVVTPLEPGPLVGDTLRYSVVRDGVTTMVDVPVTAYPLGAQIAAHAGALPLVVLMVAMSSFVFLKRPRDRAARALFVTAAVFPLGITAFPLATQVVDLVDGPRLWPFVLGDIANTLAWGALLHFTLVFPEGRVPVPRWLVAAGYALPFVLHTGYVAVTVPRATSALEAWGRIVPVSITAGRVMPILVAAAVVVAYRTAGDAEARQRVLWVISAVVGIAVLYLGLGQIPAAVTGEPLVPWDWQPLLWSPFPVILAAAVLRYRLFDISVIVRRSLVYGTLTAALIGVYIVVVLLLGRVFESPANVSALLATAVVAVLFQPLREWLRRRVSRLIFGARDDPDAVMARLGQQLEVRTSTESILGEIVTSLAATLRLPHVRIDVAGEEPSMSAAMFGKPSGDPVTVELRHRGELVGALLLDAGPTREPFGPGDQALLDAVARQVAAAVHDVLLTARLQRSLGQVVTAREEERRRLRRDIHDGIGPTLAAGSMRLEVARRALRVDPEKADELLADLASSQQTVITELRRLVNGLRPPVLDQLGLASALREQAGSFTGDGAPLQVRIDIPESIEPLTAAVEVAGYHIVREALTNVARHAKATECRVQLWRDGDALHAEVKDNGRGLPSAYRAGVGLSSMRERAAELGGTVEVSAGADGAAGTGTTVRVRLPITPTA